MGSRRKCKATFFILSNDIPKASSPYAFKNYIMIIGSYKEVPEGRKDKTPENEQTFYFKEEEEIYHKASQCGEEH